MSSNRNNLTPHRPPHVRQRGLSLIELLVALTIGGVLIFGASQVYVDGRNAYAANESVARLQETARYALAVMEPDIRMSNYWGLLKGAEPITGKQPQTVAPDVVLGGAAATSCGNNFGLDLETNLQGSNNAYVFGCNAYNNRPVVTADTITIRRASINASTIPPAVGPLRICTTRTAGTLVKDTAVGLCTAAAAVPPTGQIQDLIVNAYYLDRDSLQQAGLPSLRRKALNAVPDFQDDEITPGIEDMQIQYGIDPTGGVGANRGSATQYLDAGAAFTAALTAGAQVVSVRIWLLVRADTPENGFTDDRIYEYGDRLQANGLTGDLNNAADALKAYQPSLNPDNSFTGVKRYRRLLVSRTIQIRNALGT